MQAKTIQMAQALLDWGKQLWEESRYDEAIRVLSRLLGLRTIPSAIAERAQFYLGDIQLAQGHYSKARRHLSAAIATGTHCGETHFLMACALEWDEEGDQLAALKHYRRAVELEPGQPLYSSAYAIQRIRNRQTNSVTDKVSLRRLRDAFSASPDDPDIVYNYIYGLMEMNRLMEAEVALQRARKQWPDHPAFEGLWHDYLVQRGLVPPRPELKLKTRTLRVVSDEPVILPLPGVRSESNMPLTRRSNLQHALATLSNEQIAALAKQLRVRRTSTADPRQQVERAMLNRKKLQLLVARLSASSRMMLQIMRTEGSGPVTKRVRVDGPSKSTPHFSRRPASKPLDELRRLGLAYATTEKAQAADSVFIPPDLGEVLDRVLAN